MKKSAPTARAAASTSSRVASGRPKAMLSEIVPEKRKPSCGTMPELRAQRVLRDVAQVVAVDEHAAAGRVVEAGHELGEGGLPGAGRADQRDGLARRDVERDVVQRQHRVLARPVGEGHVRRRRSRRRGGRAPARRAGPRGPAASSSSSKILSSAAMPALVGRVELRELLDRVEEVVQRGHEADEHADLDVAVDHLECRRRSGSPRWPAPTRARPPGSRRR